VSVIIDISDVVVTGAEAVGCAGYMGADGPLATNVPRFVVRLG
jgi:hypothetical protein